MADIVIRPGNPLDFEPGALEGLADTLRATFPDYQVVVESREQKGYGVTWWEVIQMYFTLEDLAHLAEISVATGAAVEWLRRRAKARIEHQRAQDEAAQQALPPRKRRRTRQFEPSIRPTYLQIYGSDGKLLKSLSFSDPDKEPEDRTEEDRTRGQ